jgi:hypothetical protein
MVPLSGQSNLACCTTDGKTLTQTGVWIGFDYAISDPALSTALNTTLPPKNKVLAKDWEFGYLYFPWQCRFTPMLSM